MSGLPRGSDCLVVTVLYHADLERIGERHRHPLGQELHISRLEPRFGQPGVAARELEDTFISRRPLIARPQSSGGVHLVPPHFDGSVTVQRRATHAHEPLHEPTTLSAAEIRDGVVITLADRVALELRAGADEEVPLSCHGLAGVSAEMQRVRRAIDELAPGRETVLLHGETGTGKELVARALHAASDRRTGPFVAVNMAAIPVTTAASQLFGHARGAFTGAQDARGGFFAQADGGTLFLDELGETPAEIQPLLLRALESGEVQPVGGTVRRVDVRLFAATDADLPTEVARGAFRAALFHRVAGNTIELTALRKRRADIAVQLATFLREELPELERHGLRDDAWLPFEVMLDLLRHRWPGNSRELRAAAQRMARAHGGRDVAEMPPLSTRRRPSSHRPRESRQIRTANTSPRALSAESVARVLADHQYRVSPTAAALGIAKNTLYALMAEHGIPCAKDLQVNEIEAARRAVGDDVPALASYLRVSPAGLKLRLKQLESA